MPWARSNEFVAARPGLSYRLGWRLRFWRCRLCCSSLLWRCCWAAPWPRLRALCQLPSGLVACKSTWHRSRGCGLMSALTGSKGWSCVTRSDCLLEAVTTAWTSLCSLWSLLCPCLSWSFRWRSNLGYPGTVWSCLHHQTIALGTLAPSLGDYLPLLDWTEVTQVWASEVAASAAPQFSSSSSLAAHWTTWVSWASTWPLSGRSARLFQMDCPSCWVFSMSWSLQASARTIWPSC